MTDLKRILIVAPHADDEVLGCGGAIQHFRSKGHQVFVNVVSNRVLNHAENPNYIRETKEIISSVAKILDVNDVYYCDLPDEQLDNKLIDVIAPIENVVDEVKPHLVFVPNGDDSDQDHRAVAAACRVACRWVDEVRVYEVPGPTRFFQPNLYLNIEPYLEKKIAAMELYEGELRPYPHPRSREGIEIHAKARGLESNLVAAEAFFVSRRIVRTP